LSSATTGWQAGLACAAGQPLSVRPATVTAMVAWQEIEADAPEFAGQVRALFQARKHNTMATLRADGSPRISGIETQIGEQVTFGSMAASRKLADLERDPLVALHSPSVDPPEDDPGGWAGEAKISGRAVPSGAPEHLLMRVTSPPTGTPDARSCR
jgi:hypothetical protein